jgi:hypothetical protein
MERKRIIVAEENRPMIIKSERKLDSRELEKDEVPGFVLVFLKRSSTKNWVPLWLSGLCSKRLTANSFLLKLKQPNNRLQISVLRI